MKLKRLWLYILISVLFIASFYVVNLRFDKFYRINGINNDNRVILEEYLDEDEQEYLVENQIDLNLFFDYIKIDGFSLYNYQYYDLLKNNTDLSDKEIVSLGNRIQERLSTLYSKKLVSYASLLIENNLENAFLNNDNFNFDYLDYYVLLSPLYDNDYSFVDDTSHYIEVMHNDDIDEDDFKTYFEYLVNNYTTRSNISDFMNATILSSDYRVYNPSDLLTVLDDHSYIGNYEPNNLIMISSVKRVKYATYITADTNKALEKMNNAYSKDINNSLIVYNGYLSSSINSSYTYREFQLGTSVDLSLYQYNYNNFDETSTVDWLEENAYKYGFILRYPKNKASYTGESYNAHIYRYVGKETAKTIHDENLSLEEYIGSED